MSFLSIQGGALASFSGSGYPMCSLDNRTISNLQISNPCSEIRSKYFSDPWSITNFQFPAQLSTSFFAFKDADEACIVFQQPKRLSEHQVIVLLRDHYSEKIVELLKKYEYFKPVTVFPDFKNELWVSFSWSSFVKTHRLRCEILENSIPSCTRNYGCFELSTQAKLLYCRSLYGCLVVGQFARIKDHLCNASEETLDPFLAGLKKHAINHKLSLRRYNF